MANANRGVMSRIQAAYERSFSYKQRIVFPYLTVLLSLSFLQTVAVPRLLPVGLASVVEPTVAVLSAIVSIVLSCAAIAVIVSDENPSEDGLVFSTDSVGDFIAFGWSTLKKIFRTYLRLLAYLLLIPLAVLVLIGIVVALAFGGVSGMSMFGIVPVIVGIASFFVIIFIAYRSTRSTFVIIHALKNERFDKENFESALKLVDGKWWNVFGNYLAISLFFLVLMFAFGMLGGIASSFLPSSVSVKDVGEFFVSALSYLFTVFSMFFLKELYEDYALIR